MKTRISSPPSPVDAIRSYAHSLGFDTVGFTTPTLPARARDGLSDYIANDHHGDMAWMADRAVLRADPKALWPEVESIIVVGHNYAPETNPLDKLAQKTIGNISCYAGGDDYHDVMKKKLRVLARWMAEEYSCDVKLFVDTAPVMEKALAEQAGLGWQGKHSVLVSRDYGNWLFLGSIFTTLSMAPTPSDIHNEEFGHCGRCTRCIDICPTQAIIAPGKLDSRRCIAYLTNEHKGQIPIEFRKAIGNRIYGCDDCLAICPWNKFAKASKEIAYKSREHTTSPLLRDLIALDDAKFRAMFSGSPIKRIGRDRFVRNVLVAAGNSEDPSLIALIEPLTGDASWVVAEMAAWALEELRKCPT